MRRRTNLPRKRLASAYVVTAVLAGASVCPSAGAGALQRSVGRPAWVEDGMPDTVWILVEAATATSDRDGARDLLKRAERLARQEVVGHESDVERRLALAVVLGLRADREGGSARVRAASELHGELVRILELQPDHAGARHLLGRLHAGVRRMNRVTRWIATNLLGGDVLRKATWAEAEQNLAFAATHAPDVSDHHLQLANLYRDTNRPELALEEVDRALSLPARSPLERAVLEEARELKATLTSEGHAGTLAPPR